MQGCARDFNSMRLGGLGCLKRASFPRAPVVVVEVQAFLFVPAAHSTIIIMAVSPKHGLVLRDAVPAALPRDRRDVLPKLVLLAVDDLLPNSP